jgi:hypothetical protein
MPKAIESQGSRIAYSDGGSPSSFTSLGNITGISDLGGGSAPVNDVSNLDSIFREKMMGLPDEGQVTLTLNPDPDNTGHIALRSARKTRTRLEFRCTGAARGARRGARSCSHRARAAHRRRHHRSR